MHTPLEQATLDRLAALPLPPTVRGLLDALTERVGVRPGYFTHPLALPVLTLPRWLGAPDAVMGDLAFAGATGYLAVRAQDDLIDDGIGDPGEVTLLAGLLLHHHDAALAALRPGPVLWARARQTWAAYAEAMLVERALHHSAPYTDVAFEAVLDRSRPLALPAAAWLCAAGRAEELPDLAALTSALVRAHQRHTDLLDLETDRAAGRRTWLLARLGDPPTAAALRRRLLIDGGLDEAVAIVEEDLAALQAIAARMALPQAAEFAASRRAQLHAARQRILSAFFTALLGG